MRTLSFLLAASVVTCALWANGVGGEVLGAILGPATVLLVLAALGFGLIKGPATRAVILGLGSFASLSFSILFLTIGGHGVHPSITVNEFAFAVGVALAILAVEEAIRAVLARQDRPGAPAAWQDPSP
jgi:hypothetical protein